MGGQGSAKDAARHRDPALRHGAARRTPLRRTPPRSPAPQTLVRLLENSFAKSSGWLRPHSCVAPGGGVSSATKDVFESQQTLPEHCPALSSERFACVNASHPQENEGRRPWSYLHFTQENTELAPHSHSLQGTETEPHPESLVQGLRPHTLRHLSAKATRCRSVSSQTKHPLPSNLSHECVFYSSLRVHKPI